MIILHVGHEFRCEIGCNEIKGILSLIVWQWFFIGGVQLEAVRNSLHWYFILRYIISWLYDIRSKLASFGKYCTISTWAFAFDFLLNH